MKENSNNYSATKTIMMMIQQKLNLILNTARPHKHKVFRLRKRNVLKNSIYIYNTNNDYQ